MDLEQIDPGQFCLKEEIKYKKIQKEERHTKQNMEHITNKKVCIHIWKFKWRLSLLNRNIFLKLFDKINSLYFVQDMK